MGKKSQRTGGTESCKEDIARHKKKKKVKDEVTEESESTETPTVSIAVAGSIIDNTQSFEQATRLAGQIARAATIFRVDEVVVFDDERASLDRDNTLAGNDSGENEGGAAFLVRILRYLETPQYLRKALFPKCSSLRFVGLLPPLDAPHHLRKHEWGPFREGVTLKREGSSSLVTPVDVGLSKNVNVNEVLEPGLRVTVAMGQNRNLEDNTPRSVVSPSKPREENGAYWGYKVRYASNFSSALKECPYKSYDLLIGTSEHGQKISSSNLSLPKFRHLLISFGGLAGLEESIEEDSNLKGKKTADLFHSYLNTCPLQGSRTIRTEEALLISLQYFQEPIQRALKN